MSKNKFAKVFDVNEYQVLVMKEEFEDSFDLVQMTSLENHVPHLKAKFDTEETRDRLFDNYSQEDAEKFFRDIQDMGADYFYPEHE